MLVILTNSISGFVLKVWKSSSFIDTNILASIPREVPMPCKMNKHAEQRFVNLVKLCCACSQGHKMRAVTNFFGCVYTLTFLSGWGSEKKPTREAQISSAASNHRPETEQEDGEEDANKD